MIAQDTTRYVGMLSNLSHGYLMLKFLCTRQIACLHCLFTASNIFLHRNAHPISSLSFNKNKTEFHLSSEKEQQEAIEHIDEVQNEIDR